MDSSLPDSSVHGILQARILEWVASSFSRGSSRPRDGTGSSMLQADYLSSEPPVKQVSKLINYLKIKKEYSFPLTISPLGIFVLECSYHIVRESAAVLKEGPHIAVPLRAGIDYQACNSTSPSMTPICNISVTSLDAERKRDVLPSLGPAQLKICEQNKYGQYCQKKKKKVTDQSLSLNFRLQIMFSLQNLLLSLSSKTSYK